MRFSQEHERMEREPNSTSGDKTGHFYFMNFIFLSPTFKQTLSPTLSPTLYEKS